MRGRLFLLSIISLIGVSCQYKKATTEEEAVAAGNTHTSSLPKHGAEPWAISHEGKYYYTQGSEGRIILWETGDTTGLPHATQKDVWIPTDPNNSYHLWAPETHRINNKWYIYLVIDDGNMGSHQIYVVENEATNPMEGTFTTKGHIWTDKDNSWAIHTNTFEHDGQCYIIWRGWQKRKIDSETQCIYIAIMENPWTLSSDRIPIPKPKYKWKCRWVNPDGSETTYPIHIDEAPQYFESKDKDKACIFYSASSSWTSCYYVGLLTADTEANLLNPALWKKSPVPVLRQDPENSVHGPGGIPFTPPPGGKRWYILCHACQISNDAPGASDSCSPRLQKVDWNKDRMPMLGTPQKEEGPIARPSGSPIHKKQN